MFRSLWLRSQWTVMAAITMGLLGLMMAACNFTVRVPQTSVQTDVTPNPKIDPGTVAGYIWDDLCVLDVTGFSLGCVNDQHRGQILPDGIFGKDESGIADVQVSIGRGICPSRGYDRVKSSESGFYEFDELAPGEYCISVEYPASSKLAKLESGTWTYPKTDDGIGVGWVTVTILEGERQEGVNFGWGTVKSHFVEPTQDPPENLECVNKATFVEDVTAIDGVRFSKGEEFEKVWRLKNSGSCVWDTSYSVLFASGNRMNGPETVPLPGEVSPGERVDVGVFLKAPMVDGSYKGYWKLRSESGEEFGIGADAEKSFWVQINVGKAYSRDSVVSWNYELNPDNLADEGRWIDVDLDQQLLTAYEGSTPIMRFVISSGRSATPTVTGQFRIWVKLSTTDMTGPGYSLEDVPFTMYFYQGYGLHGTYWHDNFGTPMSHGCVNLRTSDASWLFDFASEGTLVNVHP